MNNISSDPLGMMIEQMRKFAYGDDHINADALLVRALEYLAPLCVNPKDTIASVKQLIEAYESFHKWYE